MLSREPTATVRSGHVLDRAARPSGHPGAEPAGIRGDRAVQKLSGAVDRAWTAVYGCRPAVVLVTEVAPHRFQLPIGRAREFHGYQDDHEVYLGPRPVRDPRGQAVSAVDPAPRRRNPAARHLREELPCPETATHGQDPEEAWPQAWVHHQGHQGHEGGRPPPDGRPTARWPRSAIEG